LGLENQVEVATSSPPERLLDRLLVFLRGPKLAWVFSIAVLSTALVAAWFFFEQRQLRQELARTESQRVSREQREHELQQQVTSEELRADKLSEELERLRLGQTVATPSPETELKVASTFATLIFTLGGSRATDAGPPAVLVIPAGTEQVRVQLNLREDDYSSYRAVLQSAGGNTIFTSRRVTTVNKQSGPKLTLLIPARVFSAGDYILTLRGISKTGDVEDVSKSLFRVERK
jgi:cell division protein FtsL